MVEIVHERNTGRNHFADLLQGHLDQRTLAHSTASRVPEGRDDVGPAGRCSRPEGADDRSTAQRAPRPIWVCAAADRRGIAGLASRLLANRRSSPPPLSAYTRVGGLPQAAVVC